MFSCLFVVILLYSTKFVAANGMINYAAIGIYFKAVTWAIGFILLAKGASKVFFWSELLGNTYMLLFNLLGYYLLGLTGMGISFLRQDRQDVKDTKKYYQSC